MLLYSRYRCGILKWNPGTPGALQLQTTTIMELETLVQCFCDFAEWIITSLVSDYEGGLAG